MTPKLLSSHEGDPLLRVNGVNVITGDYTETEIDHVIPGPDPIQIMRSYNSFDYATGENIGCWKANAHCTFIIGKDVERENYLADDDHYEYMDAFTGEPNGSILTYGGWQNVSHETRSEFTMKINARKDAKGLANFAQGLGNGAHS